MDVFQNKFKSHNEQISSQVSPTKLLIIAPISLFLVLFFLKKLILRTDYSAIESGKIVDELDKLWAYFLVCVFFFLKLREPKKCR